MKKGFTLVELLSIIVIIGIMSVVVLPRIGDNKKNNEAKEREKKIQIIESAARTYYALNRDSISVDVETLIEDRLILDDGIEEDGCVRFSKDSNNVTQYQYYENCEAKAVKLIVEKNGGTSSQTFDSNKDYYTNDVVKLESPKKNNADFIGWKVVRGDSILDNDKLIIGYEDTTIYALYENQVKLTVNLNGGNNGQSYDQYYKTNKEINLIEPTKNGYTFNKWSLESGNSILSGNTIIIGTQDTSIKALYGIDTYTIGYTLNGGSATNPTSYNIETNTITLNNPTRNGYTFAGWTGSNGSTKQTTVTIPKGSTGNKSYTANYNTIGYTISYTLNGGSATNPTSYNIETNTITLNNPTRNGYTFAGWTGSNGSTNETTVTIPKGSTGNKNYTANWTARNITCEAGKYLRASDASCQACPGGGVYCPGGTFTYNESDQGKTTCPTGYNKSDASAIANTGCYMSVAAGYYKTTPTETTTAQCAIGSYNTTHNSYYNSGDSCIICQPSGETGANGTTSAKGQSSCNASCNKTKVASWNVASWNNNSPSNVCSVKTCASGYELYNGNCVLSNASENLIATCTGNCLTGIPNSCGLFKDANGDFRFTGSNPCNYATFNGETWRIIGIFNGRIKLMRDAVIGQDRWYSTTSTNAWVGSAVELGLNGNYLTTTGYLGSSLSSDAQNLIDNADWYTTAIIPKQNTASVYAAEHRGSTISRKVGLIYPSDYGYASSACYNDSTKKLWDSTEENSYRSDICKNSNWMYMSSTDWWTISPSSDNSECALFAYPTGLVAGSGVNSTNSVRPVVYLKSDVKISGDGKTTYYTFS